MPSEVLARTGKMVGFDFGLKTFLTASDRCDIISPLFFKQNSNFVAKLNRELSRKNKGSNNRKKARLKLAKAHEHIANLRKNFHFKLANHLCSEYAFIFIEDLNIKAMQRLWSKKISDLSHSQFVQILKWQAVKFGTTVVEIPRFYPSSKTCSNCDHRLKELSLNQRSWVCPNCGVDGGIKSKSYLSVLWFQSTHPTRGATLRQFSSHSPPSISIHAPHKGVRCGGRRFVALRLLFQSTHPTRGCDIAGKFIEGHSDISIHAPHKGMRRNSQNNASRARHFNPRTPQGDATHMPRKMREWAEISIHAPRKGMRLLVSEYKYTMGRISIHAPRKGMRHLTVQFTVLEEHFNPRTPQGGATL